MIYIFLEAEEPKKAPVGRKKVSAALNEYNYSLSRI
jgi:hypothetical protein